MRRRSRNVIVVVVAAAAIVIRIIITPFQNAFGKTELTPYALKNQRSNDNF